MKTKGEMKLERALNGKMPSSEKLGKQRNISEVCMEIESDNREGKTRDLFEKIREKTRKFKS